MAGMGGGAIIEEVKPSLVEIASGYSVASMTLKDFKIVSIHFYKGSSSYVATLSLDSIALFDSKDNSQIAEFNINKRKTLWYLNHRCNFPEFADGEDVRCLACNVPGSNIQDVRWNREILKENGRAYSKELSEALRKDILDYVSRFDAFCKK